jgi:hypothetical protein
MSDLPPGFTIVQPAAASGPGAALPPGFTLQGAAPIAQEAPNVLERIGHGADRTVGGIHQAFLELKAKLAGPDLQSQITGKTKAQQELDNYTKGLNEDEALYQKGRGKDAGIDWASLGGSAGMGAPLMLIPGAGEGLLARAGLGAVQGGLDAAAQPTATGSMLDRAKAAGIGTVTGAVAAPIAGTISDKLVGALNTVKGRASGLVADKSAGRVLQDVPDLANAPPAVRGDLIKEAQAQIAQSGKLDAAAVARKANLLANDVTPTTSMVTRDPAQWTRERNLQKLAQSPDEALSNTGQELTRVYQGNDQALTAKMGALAKPYGAATQEGRGMVAMQNIDALAESSQKDVKAVYDQVKATKGDQLASDARNVVSTLHDPDVADNAYAEPIINSVSKRLKRFGMIDDEGKLTSQTMTVTQAEEFRKFLQTLKSGDPKTDRIATMFIKATDSDVLSGTGENAFGAGRNAASARFDMLGNPATQKLLDNIGELGQGRTAQGFIKTHVISAPEQDVGTLLATIGKMPDKQSGETLNALRGGMMEHLQDAAVKQNGQFSGTALTKAMDAIGPSKLKMVLGNDAHAQLDSLARAGVDATYEPAYGAVNHSNTAPMLLSLVKGGRGLIGPNLPLINDTVVGALEKHAARSDAAGKLADALGASIGKPKGGLSPELQKRLAALLTSGAAPTAATGINQLLQPSR